MRVIPCQCKMALLRSSILVPLLFIFLADSYGQDAPINFGKVNAADFTINSPLIDSATNAVVVFDKGDMSFEGNRSGWFSYVFKRSKRIKIINKKGFDLATLELSLYQNDDSKETVDKLAGFTYNLENGEVKETRLNTKDIFEEKKDKNHLSKKFTMPAVKEGSIIEYSYIIKSDFTFNLPGWEFQSADCPVLWSECNVVIPGMLSYMTFFQGYHRYFIDKSSEGFQSYSIRNETSETAYTKAQSFSVSAPTTGRRWVMKDLPAFNIENFISSPVNFIDKISFQLYKTYDGQNYHDVANTWKKVTEELMRREDFGKYLDDENGWLDRVLNPVLKENENEDLLQAAKKIYYHVQANYNCTNHYDKYIKTSLQDVVKKKSGTVGDINLLMIALLKHRGIRALPVLLSTTDVGRNSADYPQMERLNYVIGKITIGTTDYYLDAATPFLPFGKLPLKCYNGHARVISNDTAAVYFEPDSLKESSVVNVFIFNEEKNEVTGTYKNSMGFFESLNSKKQIAKSGLAGYTAGLKQSLPEEILAENIGVDSFQYTDEPVVLKYDFKLNLFEGADIVYFNPLMGEAIKKNPFYAAERMYPVELPYTRDELYILNMEIPKGYRIDEQPKSERIMLNEDEGMFEYIIKADAGMVQLKCRLLVKKTNFTGKDYQTLRDFYTYIVKKEAEQIVFKKIK
ncbi:MAG: DUF3857 domain-containing protein [Chitinophagaceae bacterium]|nr:DUF3857 domain-containing protein [Chitinophagaceae bacterium]